jgi:hypothetical protein
MNGTIAPMEAITSPGPAFVPGTPQRFTLDGSDALECHLKQTCERALAGVLEVVPRRKLEALVLAGGYGRGEGGVWQARAGDWPYNDLDFYVCLKGSTWRNERRYTPELEMLGRQLSPGAGVEVEFKIFSLAKLRRSPVSMFFYDLVTSHRWLLGEDRHLWDCDHHREAESIPLCEATRLLMNRCSGLLFASEKLQTEALSPDDADFIGRNFAKAELALGDVLLVARRRYHWSCRERHERLTQLVPGEDMPWFPEVLERHATGVNFKLHPRRTTTSWHELRDWHTQLTALTQQVWLWLESRRLGCPFASVRDYACSELDKCPETNPWRNRAVNTRTFGLRALFAPRADRYPRERLFNSLCWLFWEPEALSDPLALEHAQAELNTNADSLGGLINAYEVLWRQFR